MKQMLMGLVLVTTLATGSGSAQQNNQSTSSEDEIKIRIIIDGTALNATLDDNAAARKFAAMLPIDIMLEDYHGIEKVYYLSSRLPTDDEPEDIDPDVGDITYFAPWGNLAIFYRDFGYSRGLVRLGRIETGIEHLARGGPLSARIEPAGEAE